MKNKLSLFAVPYVGWMSIFVVAPIIIMVVYAFSTAAGDFTLENFARMGTYTAVFTRSFKLAIIATLIALLIDTRYPICSPRRGRRCSASLWCSSCCPCG